MKSKLVLPGLIFAISTSLLAFFVFYLQSEHFIYFWDYGGYQSQVNYLALKFGQGGYNWLADLTKSIQDNSYNLVPVYPLIIPRLLFGDSRLTYILSLISLYGLPTIIVLSILYSRYLSPYKKSPSFFLAFLVIILLPQFWTPTLRGHLDLSAVLITSIVLLLRQKKFFDTPIYNSIFTGILLAIAIISRHYFVYWTVGFFVAVVVDAVFYFRENIQANSLKMLRIILTFTISATIVLLTLWLVGGIKLYNLLTANYHLFYSAYKLHPGLIPEISLVIYQYGWFIFSLTVALSIFSLRQQAFARQVTFLIVLSILPVSLINTVQDPSLQHFYLLTPTLALLLTLGLESANHYRWFRFLIVPLIILLPLNFLATFLPLPEFIPKYLFTQERCYPLIRHDFFSINQLFNHLKQDEAEFPGPIYTVASSFLINYSVLQRYCLQNPLYKSLCPFLLDSYDVDLRDGFPNQFLTAKYLVLANPVQYHLRPEDQRIIGYLHLLINVRWTPLSRHEIG